MRQLGAIIPLKVIRHPSWINSERLSLISVTQSLSFESIMVLLLFQAKLLEMNSFLSLMVFKEIPGYLLKSQSSILILSPQSVSPLNLTISTPSLQHGTP